MSIENWNAIVELFKDHQEMMVSNDEINIHHSKKRMNLTEAKKKWKNIRAVLKTHEIPLLQRIEMVIFTVGKDEEQSKATREKFLEFFSQYDYLRFFFIGEHDLVPTSYMFVPHDFNPDSDSIAERENARIASENGITTVPSMMIRFTFDSKTIVITIDGLDADDETLIGSFKSKFYPLLSSELGFFKKCPLCDNYISLFKIARFYHFYNEPIEKIKELLEKRYFEKNENVFSHVRCDRSHGWEALKTMASSRLPDSITIGTSL